MPRVWVVGSAIVDQVRSVARLPRPGESVFVSQVGQFLGGKGANQAVAAHRAGADVAFVGCLGDDEQGHWFRDTLAQEGLDISRLQLTPDAPTGSASILVQSGGMNMIAVHTGANDHLSPDVVADLPVESDDVVLCQLETPDATLLAAATLPGRFILNPAPARSLPEALLRLAWAVTPNETECEAITGIFPTSAESQIDALQALRREGVSLPVLTLGEQGAAFYQEDISSCPAPIVEAVDTTAAGDVFNGYFAAGMADGMDVQRAIERAVKAASVSVTRMGAIASVPFLSEL